MGTRPHLPAKKSSTSPRSVSLNGSDRRINGLSWVILLTALVATTLIYYRALDFGFTDWDDNGYIFENKELGPFSWDQLVLQFKSFVMGNYHPLTMLSYSLDIQLFGADPRVLHRTNLVLHLLNSLLVFAFLRRLTNHPTLAALAVALFALHPMRVEAVAWIADRKDLLMLFFGLICLVAWMRWLRSASLYWYVVSLIAFICACLSKGMAVSLAPTLFLIDLLWKKPVFTWQALKEKLPFLVIALGFGLLAVQAQGEAVGEVERHHVARAIVATANLPFYLAQQFIPIGLHAHYGYPVIMAGWPPWYYFVLAATVLLIAWWWWRRPPHPVVLFAVLFFVINIAPVLQFIPVGYSVRADRYTYLSGIGWSLLAAWILFWIGERWKLPQFGIVVGVCYALVLGVMANQRVPVWADAISVWDDMIEGLPEAGHFHESRASSLVKYNRLDEALVSMNTAMRLGGKDREGTLFQRGVLLMKMNRFKEATEDLQRVVDMKWDKSGAVAYLVFVLSQQERCEEVISTVTRYRGKVDGETDMLNARAWCLFKQGRAKAAAVDVFTSMRIKDDYSGIHFLAAYAHLARGDTAATCVELEKSHQWPLYNPLWRPVRDSLTATICARQTPSALRDQ